MSKYFVFYRIINNLVNICNIYKNVSTYVKQIAV